MAIANTNTAPILVEGSNITLTQAGQTITIASTGGGGGATPGGTDTQVQFNDGGSALGGDSGFTYNKTTNVVGLEAIDWAQTPTATDAVRRMLWDDGEGSLALTLKGGNVTITVGTEVATLVYNAEATTLTKGTVVYTYGASGQRISVKKAVNTADSTSAQTLGVVAESIASGAEGWVIVQGMVRGIDTSAYTQGDALYLSATAGQFTKTKPSAPNHLVYVGFVVKVNATSGEIFVKCQNGYELDEIHDVAISAKTDKDLIAYESSSSLWKNKTTASLSIPTGTGTTGQVTYWSGTNTITSESNLYYDSSNDRFSVGTSSPLGNIDSSLGQIAGNLSIIFGADTGLRTRTNATIKTGTIGFPHYTNSEEQILAFRSLANSASNQLYIGGGVSDYNSVTEIIFYTSAGGNAVLTGTEASRFDSSGNFYIGTTTNPTPNAGSKILAIESNLSTELGLVCTRTGGISWIVASGSGNSANTGFLSFYDKTAAAERARFNHVGNFAIGTNTFPSNNYKFIVRQGTDRNLAFAEQTSDLSIEAYNNAASANVPLRLYANPLKINGDVTIGTNTAAGYKLDINGTTRTQGDFTISDAKNVILGTTTGTKIGTATTQKIGFWNAAPIVQPTTAVAASTLVGGGGTALTDTDTFDGYTLKQVVKALRNTGLLA